MRKVQQVCSFNRWLTKNQREPFGSRWLLPAEFPTLLAEEFREAVYGKK
jgi:hypothetical protein